MAEEIVIKINVSSGEAKKKIKDTTKSVDQLAAAKKKLEKLQQQEAIDLEIVNQRIKIQRDINIAAAKSELGLADAKGRTLKQMKQFKTQAGLQNAILLETGRLASDASYGFTAIANNLSQLVSLGGSFIDTTGNIGSAFSELKKSLFGVGGLLLGFQILIGIFQSKAAMDFVKGLFGIKGALKELSDLSKSYGDNLSKLTANFRLYTDILDDSNRSEEEKIIALKKLNKEYPDYNKNISDEAKNIKDVNQKRKEYIKLLQESALSQAAQGKLEEIAGEFGISVLQNKIDLINVESKLQRDQDKYNEIIERNRAGNVRATDADARASLVLQIEAGKLRVQGLKDETDQLTSEYEKRRKIITDFVKLTDKDEKEEGRRAERFKRGLLDLSKSILNYNKQAQTVNTTSAQERLDLEEDFAKKEADRRLDSFKEKEKQRLKSFKNQVKGRKNEAELVKNAESEFNKSITDAKLEHQELLLSIDDAFITKRILLKEKEAQALAKVERQIENTEMQRLKQAEGVNEIFYAKREEQLSSDLFLAQARAADTTLTEQQRAEATLQVLNLEDQQRQLIQQRELDRIEQRKNINMEYVGFTQGISSLLSTIAGENEAMQNAALVVEKGAAIADVVIKAQSSVATRTAAEAAVPAFLPGGIPNPVKPVSLAATTKANARTKVSAGIAIANILATTLTNFKKPGGEGAATASTVQAPAFNVVGPSTTNQLLGDVQRGLSDVKLSVSLNEINEGQDTLNFIGAEANVFPD